MQQPPSDNAPATGVPTGARRFVRAPEVCARVGLCRSELYYLEQRGEFPRRVKLARNAVGWDSDEVDAWMAARLAARDAARPPAAPSRTVAASPAPRRPPQQGGSERRCGGRWIP